MKFKPRALAVAVAVAASLAGTQVAEATVQLENLAREVGIDLSTWSEAALAQCDGQIVAAFRDLNADGAPDLYVCNDFWSPDRLWINDGKGSFVAANGEAWRNSSWFSMALDTADVDDVTGGREQRDHALTQEGRADHREIV